jgi:hypothetical protein
MAQLQQTKAGWENEHLAKFLLSQISFLAHPITVSDDIGTDVVCTIFEPRVVDKTVQLFPKQAFAIQLKSSLDEVEADCVNGYLPGLELPFFLGFVDRATSSLSIYSGELLPDFFSSTAYGDAIKLVPQSDPIAHKPDWKWEKNKAGKFKVPMPLVGKLTVGDAPERIEATRAALLKLCEVTLKNIATRINQEYVFQYPGYARIIVGPGSEKVFRLNLMLRLAEGFYNLRYLFDSNRAVFVRAEFDELEASFLALKARGYPMHNFADMVYSDLKRALDAEAKAAAAKAPPPS